MTSSPFISRAESAGPSSEIPFSTGSFLCRLHLPTTAIFHIATSWDALRWAAGFGIVNRRHDFLDTITRNHEQNGRFVFDLSSIRPR
ncbi:hypothetical protein VTN77DRAFT_8356 [Rasamsonia byssochlamydoides]|uniref:uncharacterized protein n=1 Tax=Rasamsonia byssochlamydoides TaxID=89139 RepID=UPI003743AE53